MKYHLLYASILTGLLASQGIVQAQQQEEPPVHPRVIEENEPEELDVVRDIDDEEQEVDRPRDEPWGETDQPMSLQQAVDAPHRDARNRERDRYRNPAQTLEFFGVQPDMTVVEIWPGAGWYTEILGAYLAAEGTLYAAHFPADAESEFQRNARASYGHTLEQSNVYRSVNITEFAPGSHHDIAPEGSADMVLTFRNLHNWYMRGGDDAVEEAFKAFYTALRPGGVLGIVDHRLPEDRDDSQASSTGYVKQSWAIEAAEQAGFEFVDSSEVNANPRDTADHEGGVWALPPTLRHGDEDAVYSSIGESDRFTLKFRKPEE